MFVTGPQAVCAVCGMKSQDIRFVKDLEAGGAKYWANPKLFPTIDERVDFCGPDHATEWFVKRTAVARNGEAE